MSVHFNNFHKDVSKESASSGGRKDGTAGARRGRKCRGSDDESTNLAEHESVCEDQFEGGVEDGDEQPSLVD
jgi:hypothetical protein